MSETKFFEQIITLSPQSEPAGLEFPVKLAYWTFGDISNPAVLLPTCFGGVLENTSPFLYSTGPNPVLSPSKYFLIITGLLGGGESSSPSNTPEPYNGPNFPRTTYEDNVRLQHAFCLSLGVKKLFAYVGFSMGGQQAYQISALFPDFVENTVCLAGSAKTSWHNWSFLEGLEYTLTQSMDFHDGFYKEPARKGLRAFDRVYCPWALSEKWFKQKRWTDAGFKTLEEYLNAYWDGIGDANDLLLLLWTWKNGDLTTCFPEDDGDLKKTLGRIKSRFLVIASRTDRLFPPEDNEEEVKDLKNGKFRCIESVFGHLAGGGDGTKEDTEFVLKEIEDFLAESPAGALEAKTQA